MKISIILSGFLVMWSSALFSMVDNTAISSINLAILQPNQQVAGFYTEAVYSTDEQDILGARFIHKKSGFILDLLRIQTVQQAFIWVNTHPVSDRGEPHTLEHLLLGKGKKGRHVGSLEEMSLGKSSAFTDQLRTCYHFHTTAGSSVFFSPLLDIHGGPLFRLIKINQCLEQSSVSIHHREIISAGIGAVNSL